MRVAVAEDSGIFRQALVTLLTTAGIEVTVAAGSGEELLALVAEDPPDVAIVDLHMPPTHTNEGVVAGRALLARHPGIGVLVLSAYNETPQAMELFRDQPRRVGYLLKDHVTDVESLCGALERVRRGEVVIDPDVVSRLVEARHRERELSRLSGREREVLELMAEGHSNAGIGKRLHLSARTVEDHVRAIFTKLKITSSGGPPGPQDSNKRVLAVLTWLRAAETR
ncbi:response regulator transcription factor [Actinomadura violacea]|uniref:Response regulator transcription factor n=1 Tax=Actinomadura violacea TaxID=2819934 RepID=A0ABS3RWC1_9ACTN|nr:response regulator transcription factor [Actinomadura violacea]MBO2461054.1 response regulator transcription factor [Actinomadura violacea]